MAGLRARIFLVSMLTAALLTGYTNCSRVGNGSNITIMGNPMTKLSVAQYSPQGGALNLAEFNLCLAQIDLTSADPLAAAVSLSFDTLQEIAVPSSGIDLESLPIPAGTYSKIVVELSDQCSTGRSLGVVNSQGTYNTADTLSLTFNGQLTIDDSPKKITFNVQPIVDNLRIAASDSEVVAQATHDPGTYLTSNIWLNLSSTGAPEARDNAAAVWTGNEMIVWGGQNDSQWIGTGGKFNPSTGTWTATSTGANAPSAQFGSAVVWTGTEMLVWSGQQLEKLGSRYNPSSDTWSAISTVNAPSARHSAAAVWTGSEMIVWGGWDGSKAINTGGRYNPSTDTWTALPTIGAPPAAAFQNQQVTAVWTGTEMIVWGGDGAGDKYVRTGGRYNPTTNSWTSLPTNGAPSARKNFVPVWTGEELIIWGGNNGTTYNDGAKYNPTTNTWSPLPSLNAPDAKDTYAGVWTGGKMIIWGGAGQGSALSATAYEYDPPTDSWSVLSTVDAPSPRWAPAFVWTGDKMLVWGGSAPISSNANQYFNSGGIYLP